jgi:hypothetical protein
MMRTRFPGVKSSVRRVTLRPVRASVCLGVAIAALAAAGCGSSDEDVWGGPPGGEADGTVAVDGFAAYQESVDERWEDSTVLVAAQFLDIGARDATTKSIRAESPTGDLDTNTVSVELEGLLDEAVRAERWMLRFEPLGSGFRLVSAQLVRSCQPGHGHEDFSADACS